MQIKLIRVSESFETGDHSYKEKQTTYEEMLQESKRAYIQLDEQYKGMMDKIQ